MRQTYPHIGRCHFTSFCSLTFPGALAGLILAFLGRLVFAGSTGHGFTAIAGLFFAGLNALVLAGPAGLGCVALAGLVHILAGLAVVLVTGGVFLLLVEV